MGLTLAVLKHLKHLIKISTTKIMYVHNPGMKFCHYKGVAQSQWFCPKYYILNGDAIGTKVSGRSRDVGHSSEVAIRGIPLYMYKRSGALT